MDVAIEMTADQILERLFSIVVEEAKERPTFAKKLLDCFPPNLVLKGGQTSKRKAAGFDPFAFSVAGVLMKSGEEALIEKLKSKTPSQLRQIAVAQEIGLDDALLAGRPKAERLQKAIVDWAKQRLEDRNAAAS
jgi:hypothetical protein